MRADHILYLPCCVAAFQAIHRPLPKATRCIWRCRTDLSPASRPLAADITRSQTLAGCHAIRSKGSDHQDDKDEQTLPFLLDVNTRGGVLFVSTLGTAGIFALYKVAIALGVEDLQAGLLTSVAVTIGIVVWTLTYVFRVANKDMTYAKQLKDYEDAVLKKRLAELQDDEVQALLEEVESEGQKGRRPQDREVENTPR